MVDVWNKIIYNLRIAGAAGRTGADGVVRGKFSNVSDTPNALTTIFPTVSCEVIDNREAASDLEFGENGSRPYVRVQAYHNTNLSDCRDVMLTACEAMTAMGFWRSTGPEPIPNDVDRKIFRMEARFTRFISDIDDIPTFTAD